MMLIILLVIVNSINNIPPIFSYRVNAGIQTRMLISCTPETSSATATHPPPLAGLFTPAEDHQHRLLQSASEVRDHAARLQSFPDGATIYRRLVRDLYFQFDFGTIERPLNTDMGHGPSLVSDQFDDYAKV